MTTIGQAVQPGVAPVRHRARNIELDWLRAYAVLLVVAFHFTVILAGGPRVFALMFGTLDFSGGVDLFFVISGFVIAGSLEPLWARPADPGVAGVIRRFFVRRFWRLWPASTLWISYCLLAAWTFAGAGGWPPVQRVAWQWATTLVPVFELYEFRHPGVLGYYWTLSVEWQFYAVFPFLLAGIRSGRGRAAALLGLFAFGLWTNQVSWMLRFSSIVGGIAIHALHRTGWRLARGAPGSHRRVRWATPALLVVLVTVPQLGHSTLVGQLGLTAISVVLVAMAASDRRLIGDCGMPGLLGWIGLRSYSLYLCHIPVALTLLAVLERLQGGRVAHGVATEVGMIAVAAAVALLMTELTYRLVEIRLQRRFGRRHAG